MKGPHIEGHHAGINPVGNKDLMIGQQGADGVPQEGRVMARHGRHQQNFWVCGAARTVCPLTLKVNQLAKRFFGNDALGDRHLMALYGCCFQAEGGFFVVLAQPMHQVEGCCEPP